MLTHRYFTTDTKMECPYCDSKDVYLLREQGYYFCNDCRRLLWQTRKEGEPPAIQLVE